MSIVYICDKKRLRAAARAYAREYEREVRVPFCMETVYSSYDLDILEREHADWFTECEWLTLESVVDWFLPHCAWCYEARWSLEDDNEHEECDQRLHYCSEQGKEEQAVLLTKEVIPHAPATVISLIMSFL